MDFRVEFPIANAVKFTRDNVNADERASFDQMRFAEAWHTGTDKKSFFQLFEQADTLRPQFYTNFPLQRLRVFSCDSEEVVATITPDLLKQYTRKFYRSDAKFTSVNGKLFIYFAQGFEYTDEAFTTTGDEVNYDGRLPIVQAGAGNIIRFNIGGTGFQLGQVQQVLWVPELQAEGYLMDVTYTIPVSVDGVAEIRYNEKEADLFGALVNLGTLNGIYFLRLEFGVTDYLVSYTSEPIKVAEKHKKSLAIGYRHEGGFDDADAWGYLYLFDWMNYIRVPADFYVLTAAGDMEVYADDYGIREQLRAVAHREITFRGYNLPGWEVDKFNVIFGHDTIQINDYLWRPSDFGGVENIENADLYSFEIVLRQKNDRTMFSSDVDVEITAAFDPALFDDIPAAGDTLVAEFSTNTGKTFKFLSLPDWISADKEEFEDGDEIEFTILENPYDVSKSITLTAFTEDMYGITAQIAFAQLAGEDPAPVPSLISVDPTTLAFVGNGEVKSVDVTADAEVQYQAISSSSWLTVPGAIQTGNQTINITAAANNSGLPRNGSVTFVNINNPDDTLTVTVSQAAIAAAYYEFENNSGNIGSPSVFNGLRVGPVGSFDSSVPITITSGSFPLLGADQVNGFSPQLGNIRVWFNLVSNGNSSGDNTIQVAFKKNNVLVSGGGRTLGSSDGTGWFSFDISGIAANDIINIEVYDNEPSE